MSDSIQLFRPVVCDEAITAAADVMRSGWIGLGPVTERFERAFAEYIGTRHAVALNSATSALHLALLAAGIGPGDEVISTSLTFVSTNHAIRYCGADPVFADIDPRTMNLDLAEVERVIGPRTKAVIAVHYGGNPLDLDALYALAKHRGIAVIEDAAHACGAVYHGQRIGARGLVCFSFHAVKNLAIGDGGMITCDRDDLAERLRRLRWMGIDRSTFSRNGGHSYQWEYAVDEVGFKYHMNDVAAAVGIAQLIHLDAGNARRAAICAAYRAGLADLPHDRLTFLDQTAHAVSANHLCVVLVADRDQVADRLRADGIGTGVHYKPNHLYPPYHQARRGSLVQTEAAFGRLLSLPLHLLLTDADVARVIAAVRRAITP